MLGVFERLSVGPNCTTNSTTGSGCGFSALPEFYLHVERPPPQPGLTNPISSEASVVVGKTCETYETLGREDMKV
jgi:hypothetical protein